MDRPRVRAREIVLTAGDVAQHVHDHGVTEAEGIERTVLWHEDESAAGVLTMEAGRMLGEHAHLDHEHHVWIAAGSARIRGSVLEPGSYWYVSPGASHTVEALDEGCTLHYVYRRVR